LAKTIGPGPFVWRQERAQAVEGRLAYAMELQINLADGRCSPHGAARE
jgi:hypothetical protein